MKFLLLIVAVAAIPSLHSARADQILSPGQNAIASFAGERFVCLGTPLVKKCECRDLNLYGYIPPKYDYMGHYSSVLLFLKEERDEKKYLWESQPYTYDVPGGTNTVTGGRAKALTDCARAMVTEFAPLCE